MAVTIPFYAMFRTSSMGASCYEVWQITILLIYFLSSFLLLTYKKTMLTLLLFVCVCKGCLSFQKGFMKGWGKLVYIPSKHFFSAADLNVHSNFRTNLARSVWLHGVSRCMCCPAPGRSAACPPPPWRPSQGGPFTLPAGEPALTPSIGELHAILLILPPFQTSWGQPRGASELQEVQPPGALPLLRRCKDWRSGHSLWYLQQGILTKGELCPISHSIPPSNPAPCPLLKVWSIHPSGSSFPPRVPPSARLLSRDEGRAYTLVMPSGTVLQLGPYLRYTPYPTLIIVLHLHPQPPDSGGQWRGCSGHWGTVWGIRKATPSSEGGPADIFSVEVSKYISKVLLLFTSVKRRKCLNTKKCLKNQ